MYCGKGNATARMPTSLGNYWRDGRAFHCDCSRAQLAAHGNVYPGTCRDRKLPANNTAVRIQVDADTPIQVEDQCQAPLVQDLDAEVGDFIIRRRDGLYAYQLAVVIDDNHQGIYPGVTRPGSVRLDSPSDLSATAVGFADTHLLPTFR